MITIDDIRAAGGIVHSDGNVFFTNIEQLNAAIAKKLAQVGVEPVAEIIITPDGEFDMGLTQPLTFSAPAGTHSLFTTEALAARAVQALEQAATVSEQSFAGDDGVVIAWRIRALIGGAT